MICNWITVLLGILVCILLFFVIRQEFKKIRENMDTCDPVLNEIKNKLKIVNPIVDTLNFAPGEKSYTINKQDVYICLRDENGKYYDENMLIYVTLHEIAHALCDEIGHTDKFRTIFQGLLDTAQSHGIYNPHIAPIQNYCFKPDTILCGSGKKEDGNEMEMRDENVKVENKPN